MKEEERRTLTITHLSTTSCTTNTTRTRLGLNQGHRFYSLANNRLSHGKVSITLSMSPAYR
jgi:hypothetical protein